MKTRIVVAIAAAAAGCAAPKPVVDDTPENPTAVFETTVASSGIAGMFPFESTERRFVRGDMRREDRATKGTGTFSGYFVTRMMGKGDSNIARLDRKVMWSLDHGRKEYIECPVQGCAMPGGGQPGKPEAQREEPRQSTEEGCVTRVAASRLDIAPTGQKRDVNGFAADQYKGAWVVRLTDNQKRTTTSTVNLEIWTTGVNTQMRQAFDTEAAFGRTLAAGAKPPEQPSVPAEVVGAMTAYLGSLSPADRATFGRSLRELEKVKGYRVSTKLDWLLEGNACGAKDEQAQARPQSGTSAVISGITSMFQKKEEAPAGPKPLLSFAIEVKQLGMRPVRDSTFALPAGYRQVKPQ